MEALIFPVLCLLVSVYFLLIGFNIHTPKMNKPPTEVQLNQFRLLSKVIGIIAFFLSIVYGVNSIWQ